MARLFGCVGMATAAAVVLLAFPATGVPHGSGTGTGTGTGSPVLRVYTALVSSPAQPVCSSSTFTDTPIPLSSLGRCQPTPLVLQNAPEFSSASMILNSYDVDSGAYELTLFTDPACGLSPSSTTLVGDACWSVGFGPTNQQPIQLQLLPSYAPGQFHQQYSEGGDSTCLAPYTHAPVTPNVCVLTPGFDVYQVFAPLPDGRTYNLTLFAGTNNECAGPVDETATVLGRYDDCVQVGMTDFTANIRISLPAKSNLIAMA